MMYTGPHLAFGQRAADPADYPLHRRNSTNVEATETPCGGISPAPQRIRVVDAVAARQRGGDQRQQFVSRVRPRPGAQPRSR